MPEPDYKREFEAADFRGYFIWNADLTKKVGTHLYHACHEDELNKILNEESLTLRSNWSVHLNEFGSWKAPGVWVGLNWYTNGNRYGPFVLQFPLSVIEGRHFIAFRRISDRHRYFFVQYDARIPLFAFEERSKDEKKIEKKLWRVVNAYSYFKNAPSGAIWDIILTTPLRITGVEVRAVEHPACIPNKCSGSTQGANGRVLKKIAKEKFLEWLKDNEGFEAFKTRFPVADEMTIQLPDFYE